MIISTIGKQDLIKLDLHDKKILQNLYSDSRIPRKQLANKLKISQERLHYKISRLMEELIDPAIILNYSLLGFKQYKILIENLSQEQLSLLKKETSVFVMMHNIGRYQYLLYVVTEDVNSFCEEFLPDSHFEIFPIIKSIPDNYNPFNLKDSHSEPIKKDRKIILDKKDYKILYYLCKNPLESILKLNERTKFDRVTILSRIRKMQEANIIQKFRFAINVFKIGCTSYFLKIKVVPKNKKKICSLIQADNYSGFIYESYNCYFVYYMPSSHRELFAFTKKLYSVDHSIKIDIIQTAEFLKINTIPEKVLEIFKERLS